MLPAAISITLNQDHTQVLLIQRSDVPVWVLPGGGIETDETAEEAVKREVFEETGFHVQILRKSAEYLPFNRLTTLTSVFICEIQSGNATLSSETAALAFFPLDHLPKMLFPPHRIWLQEGLQTTTCIRRPLTEVTYGKLFLYFCQHPWIFFRYVCTRILHSS